MRPSETARVLFQPESALHVPSLSTAYATAERARRCALFVQGLLLSNTPTSATGSKSNCCLCRCCLCCCCRVVSSSLPLSHGTGIVFMAACLAACLRSKASHVEFLLRFLVYVVLVPVQQSNVDISRHNYVHVHMYVRPGNG